MYLCVMPLWPFDWDIYPSAFFYLLYCFMDGFHMYCHINVSVALLLLLWLFLSFLCHFLHSCFSCPSRFYQQKGQFLVRVLVLNTSFRCHWFVFVAILVLVQINIMYSMMCHKTIRSIILSSYEIFTFLGIHNKKNLSGIFMDRILISAPKKWDNFFSLFFGWMFMIFCWFEWNISASDQSLFWWYSSFETGKKTRKSLMNIKCDGKMFLKHAWKNQFVV